MRMFAGVLVLALAAAAQAGDWPTVHHDAARSGCTADSPAPPFTKHPRYTWVRFFTKEQISSYVEPIVSGDTVYVPTCAGNLHALDRKDGSTRWVFNAGGYLRHSPAVAGGKIYFGCGDGKVYCLTSGGKEAWTAATGAGIWASPAVADGLVVIGSRDQRLYAFNAQTGKQVWATEPLGAPVLTTASVHEGRVFFATEECAAYAAESATGKILWRKALPEIVSLRGYFPVVWPKAGAVVLGGCVNREYRDADCRFLARLAGKTDDYRTWKPVEPTPEKAAEEQKAILARLAGGEPRKQVYVLKMDDGAERFVLPILWESGNCATHPTGAVGPDGRYYTHWLSYYNWWCRGADGFKADSLIYMYGPGRFDPQTGAAEHINWKASLKPWPDWHGPTCEYEEHYNTTIGGGRLYFAHSDEAYGLALGDMTAFGIGGRRDSYAGVWGHIIDPIPLPDEHQPDAARALGLRIRLQQSMHGPGQGALAVVDDAVFWITGSMLICSTSTPTVPPSAQAPRPAPPTPKTFPDDKVEPSDADIDLVIAEAPARRVRVPAGAKAVAEALAAHVEEMAKLDHLAPLRFFNGAAAMWIFAQPRETFEAVAPALAVLDEKPRAAAIALLDREFENYSPLARPCYAAEGLRRFPFNAGPETTKDKVWTISPPQPVFAAYGLWAYAWYGDRTEKVLARYSGLKAAMEAYLNKPLEYKWDPRTDQESQLNRAAAAMIGMARLAKLAKDDPTASAARKELARLLAARMAIENDNALVHKVAGGVAAARYLDLAPEVGRLAARRTGKARQQAWINLNAALIADWFLAWTERPTGLMNPPGKAAEWEKEYIGDEIFLSAPIFAMSEFAAKALVLGDDGPMLARYLDIPWCRGDLYYVSKCTQTLRAYAGGPYERL
jgi:outer membrane protein assembly factor BamB